jgi:uncharacterized protein
VAPIPEVTDSGGEADLLARLRGEKYISLTTFRRDGRGVATPVWFAIDGDRIVAFTGAETGKAKRIRANPCVTVAPCNLRGAVTGPAWTGFARMLPAKDGEAVMRLIRRKYRVTKQLLDLVVGIIRIARRRPQTHSVYIEIRPEDTTSNREH